MDFKAPTSKEEYREMVKSLRSSISDDDLDFVTGGNDDKPKNTKSKEGIPFTCPFCGAQLVLYQFEDGPKHMTKCPNNPYK
jgi:hypothetical protein